MHPGQRNSLDALCKRYSIDNTRRDLHGALLDARLLADVYLVMTGGQGALALGEAGGQHERQTGARAQLIDRAGLELFVRRASAPERAQHAAQLDLIDTASADGALWKKAEP
jgi:DNA polymerase-3 subunit epsilon